MVHFRFTAGEQGAHPQGLEDMSKRQFLDMSATTQIQYRTEMTFRVTEL